MRRGIFLFHRDLRAVDNNALNALLDVCDEVYPIFILDPVQVDKKRNKYFGYNAFYFMLATLAELATVIPLAVYYGDTTDVMRRLQKYLGDSPVMLGYNIDYTPFAVARDKKVCALFDEKSIVAAHDYKISTKDLKPYRKFTPFYNAAYSAAIPKPVDKTRKQSVMSRLKKCAMPKRIDLRGYMQQIKPRIAAGIQAASRTEALKILRNIDGLGDYATARDFFGPTSRLSPHLKFGTVSVREVYHAAAESKLSKKVREIFIRQLYWRDFYMQIVFHFPYVLGARQRGDEKHSGKNMLNITPRWRYNKKYFDAWRNGKTGVPIVDAGMRQLIAEGYMHNRARMIVASFLTKDLHIDWQYGEMYFAVMLTDYDPANNNGGWQWSASTGADSQPYFRMFNPWTQGAKYDPDCVYIKKYCPELAKFTPKEIHSGAVTQPIVDHAKEREVTFKLYASS